MNTLLQNDKCNIIDIGKHTEESISYRLPKFKVDEHTDGIISASVEREGMKEIPLDLLNKMLLLLLDKKKYRDVMFLVIGTNTGYRFSDLQRLRISDFVDIDGEFKKTVTLIEKKTSETRKIKRSRTCYINEAVKAAIYLYLNTSGRNKGYNDLLFTSESNLNRFKANNNLKPASRQCFENVIKGTIYLLREDSEKINCHSMRKTYSMEFLNTGNRLRDDGKINFDNDVMQLLQLQLGHSKLDITKRYTGQVNDLSEKIVSEMNIGHDILKNYIVD